eukprot:5449777-Pyramimonas_sp.AAC.1
MEPEASECSSAAMLERRGCRRASHADRGARRARASECSSEALRGPGPWDFDAPLTRIAGSSGRGRTS